MVRFFTLITLMLLAFTGCGDEHGHDHKDHAHHKDHGHDHDHDHSGPNAHLWLDPVLTRQFIERVPHALDGPLATARKENRKANLVVSIHPVASVISELVGDAATVTTMLPQGGSPHGFELTPDILRKLGSADALIIVGMSLDPWAEKAARNTGKKSLPIINFADLVKQGEPASPLAADHPLAASQAALLKKIDALHASYQETLAKVPVKEMVTFHNAFDLLAERYGLKVVAHLTEMDLPTGAEVTPKHLREARDAVKEHKLKTIYAEPAYPDTALNAIAEATGARVLRLDDLGGPQRERYRTYFEMMESNLKTLVEGQK